MSGKSVNIKNKVTNEWEIVAGSDASQISTSNPDVLVGGEVNISVDQALSRTTKKIETLQRNVSWLAEHGGGGTGYRLESFTTMGYEFYREGQPYNHTLSVRVFWNEKDTTESLNPMRFKWTRVSENTQGDTVWNERHSLGGNSIDITSADLAGDTSFRCEFLAISNNNILTKTF